MRKSLKIIVTPETIKMCIRDRWYTENQTDNVNFSMKVKEHIYSGQSDFQKIDVLDTYEFGKVLVIDNWTMITEKDEFIYHEMITHVPMSVNPSIKNVLVIGSGDGGTCLLYTSRCV